MKKNRATAPSSAGVRRWVGRRSALTPRNCSLGPELCTVVTGPPGGGKTTLLTQWYDELERSGERPVWCSPIAGTSVALPRGCWPLDDPMAGRTLFVDDADQVEPSELDDYLKAIGAGDADLPSRLVLATRPTPDHLLRWSRHGSVRTVLVDDLDSLEDVIKTILHGYRPDLDPDELALLLDKVENWPAGAHLAGQAIAHPNSRPGAARRFDGDDLGVCDYLDTEIFAGLDTADQDFLVTCSVLAELTPAACIMLTGDQLAEERLERLSRQRALVSVSETSRTWRWRPLAQRYLQTKLALRPAEGVAELRRRVRGWSMAQHSYHEVAAQASETEDWTVIVRLILDVGLDMAASGEGTTVLFWIDSLPASVRKRESGLAVVAAVATWATAGLEGQATIDDWLAHASTAPKGRPPRGAPSVGCGVDLVRSLLGTLPPDEQLMPAAEDDEGPAIEDPSWSAMRLSATGFAWYLCDDRHRARQVLGECLRRYDPATDESGWFLKLFGPSIVGLVAIIEQEAGEHDRAAVLLSMAALLSPGQQAVAEPAGLVELANARQAWHDGDYDRAMELLGRVGASARLLWVRALALLDTAELCVRRRNDSGSTAALAAADHLMVNMNPPPPVLVRLRQSLDRHEAPGIDPLDVHSLTDRELEVLRLLNSDLTRRQIASQLFLAHNTVKTYIQRLYNKLDVSSRQAAIARAQEQGWLD